MHFCRIRAHAWYRNSLKVGAATWTCRAFKRIFFRASYRLVRSVKARALSRQTVECREKDGNFLEKNTRLAKGEKATVVGKGPCSFNLDLSRISRGARGLFLKRCPSDRETANLLNSRSRRRTPWIKPLFSSPFQRPVNSVRFCNI